MFGWFFVIFKKRYFGNKIIIIITYRTLTFVFSFNGSGWFPWFFSFSYHLQCSSDLPGPALARILVIGDWPHSCKPYTFYKLGRCSWRNMKQLEDWLVSFIFNTMVNFLSELLRQLVWCTQYRTTKWHSCHLLCKKYLLKSVKNTINCLQHNYNAKIVYLQQIDPCR